MNNNEDYFFSFSPRLLLLLGDQLIKDDAIALSELVKNSYDADASLVNIDFKSLEFPQLGEIVIEDNGVGMNKEIIRDVWLKPGTDFKKQKFENNTLTPNFKRLPLGEKGIGRLGAHKIGSYIEIISKTKDDKEISLKINWEKFEILDNLDDVKINVEERERPKYFKNNTGTKIILKGLKNTWSKDKFRHIYLQLLGLQNPFSDKDNKNLFNVEINIDKEEWLKDLITLEDLKDLRLYEFDCEIYENKIKNFKYYFKPWDSLNKVSSRYLKTENLNEKDLILKDIKKPYNKICLDPNKIGKVRFRGIIFDRSSKLLSKYPNQLFRKQSLELLNEVYGIRVFRDGLRVYDYGEKGDDWLNLDNRRVNQPAMKISNNLIVASVELERNKSSGLIEKTNREGFIESKYLENLKSSLLYTINLLERFRIKDKEKLRKIYIDKDENKKNLEDTFGNVKKQISEKVPNEKDRKSLISEIDSINKQFKDIKETLLKGASNGLSLSIVIHEVEKINKEIEKVIDKEKASVKLRSLFEHLKNIIENYTQIIKGKSKTNDTICSIVKQALFNVKFRIESHNIEIINNCTINSEVKVVKNLIVGTILNLIDNSIFWLEYQEKEKKKILFDMYEDTNYISLLIADNGPGFNLDSETAVKPFISGKPNDSGMGIGLHLAEQVMISHSGSIEFTAEEFDLPKEFDKGGIVVLKFKK